MKTIITEGDLMVHFKVWLVSTRYEKNWDYLQEGANVRSNLQRMLHFNLIRYKLRSIYKVL